MHYLGRKVIIPSDNSFRFLQLKSIIRIEAQGSYSVIHLLDGQKIFSCKNIGYFNGLMWETTFFKTHKSHLINTEYINFYHRSGSVSMIDGSSVPVSRRRKEAFKSEVLEPYYPYPTKRCTAKVVKLPAGSALG